MMTRALYKQYLKLLISLRPCHSQACNSLLPFLQCIWTVEATIKLATWPLQIHPACMPKNPSTDGAARSVDGCAYNRSIDSSAQLVDSTDQSMGHNICKRFTSMLYCIRSTDILLIYFQFPLYRGYK